jgi:hypothetical protein
MDELSLGRRLRFVETGPSKGAPRGPPIRKADSGRPVGRNAYQRGYRGTIARLTLGRPDVLPVRLLVAENRLKQSPREVPLAQ